MTGPSAAFSETMVCDAVGEVTVVRILADEAVLDEVSAVLASGSWTVSDFGEGSFPLTFARKEVERVAVVDSGIDNDVCPVVSPLDAVPVTSALFVSLSIEKRVPESLVSLSDLDLMTVVHEGGGNDGGSGTLNELPVAGLDVGIENLSLVRDDKVEELVSLTSV